MPSYSSAITQPTGRVFFSFLKRNADGLYFRPADNSSGKLAQQNGTFEAFNPVTADEATRAPFRIVYEEDQNVAGSYEWLVNTENFLEGNYSFTSQELSAGTEFDIFLTKNITVSNGQVDSDQLRVEIEYSAGASVFMFLERLSDGLFYVPGSQSFALFDITAAPAAERASFRVSLAENPAGFFSVDIDVSEFSDGTYRVFTRELVAGVEIIAGNPADVLVSSGAISQGVALGSVGINHNTTGEDALAYKTAGGEGISGATVRVFLKADFDGGSTDEVKGITMTDALGRWEAPVYLPVGNTYTVVYNKIGAFGPDTVEVTV